MAMRKFEVGKFYAYRILWKNGTTSLLDAEVTERCDERGKVAFLIGGWLTNIGTIEKQPYSQDEFCLLAPANNVRYGILIQSKVPYNTREEALDAIERGKQHIIPA